MKGALILAGGMSTRFGGNKALAALGGEPLLAHVARTAAKVAGEVVVAIGRGSSINMYEGLVPRSARFVKDQLRAKGPLVGILTGFQVMESEYSAVLSCDAPFVRDDILRLLFRRAVHSDAAIPKWPNGDIEPLQSVYKVRSVIQAAREALDCEQLRNADMIKRLGRVTYVPVREIKRLDHDLVTFFNVNRRSDLSRAETLRGSSTG